MGFAASPNYSSAALLFLSLLLLASQFKFSRAHHLAKTAERATLAAFEALPDAVLIVDSRGVVNFNKDVAAPRVAVLPALVIGQKLVPRELYQIITTVLESKTASETVLTLADGRVLECRGTLLEGVKCLLVARDITEAHQDSERIRYLATYDALTGLLNRSSFHVSVEQAIARSNRSKRPFGLLFIDLDKFKAVNDTLGHGAGDALLKEVAVRIKEVLRKSDSAYRLAGDEFTVLIENLEDESDIALVAEKLCVSISRPYFDEVVAPQVSASIGTVCFPANGSTAEALVRVADTAMYQAKALGRNQSVCALVSPKAQTNLKDILYDL